MYDVGGSIEPGTESRCRSLRSLREYLCGRDYLVNKSLSGSRTVRCCTMWEDVVKGVKGKE